MLTPVFEQKNSTLKVVYVGLQTCVAKDLLTKSLNSEFAIAPELDAQPSLAAILEHFAFRAAPLNENAKPFDPDRPFFDYSIHLDLPQIEKDFREGYLAKHLPVDHSHPYLEMFFDSNFKADEYSKRANYVEKKAPKFERKPLRVEAIVKIQKALGVRQRSKLVFSRSIGILEAFLESDSEQMSIEDVQIIETEYNDFVELCRDPNHFLKKDSLRSEVGKHAFDRMSEFKRFTSKCRKSSNLQIGSEFNWIICRIIGTC